MGVTPHSFWGYFVVFIAGVLIGALGQYYAQFFTDRRRAREARYAAEDAAHDQRQSILTMGSLVVQQLRPWLERYPTAREFVTIPNGDVMVGGVIRLIEDKTPGVTTQAAALYNAGHIRRVRDTPFGRYEMPEDFVAVVMGQPQTTTPGD